MHRYSYFPNFLSSLRIALAPAILAAAVSDSQTGFWLLFGITLTTDVLDGALARRWRAATNLGARLDRWGDGLTMISTAAALQFLWPNVIEAEWPWMLVALAGYLLIGVRRVLLPKDFASHPRWYSIAVSWFVPLSLVPLLMAGNPWPFRYAVVVHWIVAAVKVLAPFPRTKRSRAIRRLDRVALELHQEQPAGHT